MKRLAYFLFSAAFFASCNRCIECTNDAMPNPTITICKDQLSSGHTLKEGRDNLEREGYECEMYYD
jgi:hypothetical protein